MARLEVKTGGLNDELLASKMKTETYYAIRIGVPKRHGPYLMLNPGQLEPKIFAARATADEFLAANKGASRKVVKVRVTYAG
jgi:hypothetical protein